MTTHPHDARSFRLYAQVSPDGTVLAYTQYADGTYPTDLSTIYVDVTDRPDLWDVPQIPPEVTRVAMSPVSAIADAPVEALPQDGSLPADVYVVPSSEEPPVELPIEEPLAPMTETLPLKAPKKSAKKVTKKKV